MSKREPIHIDKNYPNDHPKIKILTRFKCKEDKMEKVASKAYVSKQKIKGEKLKELLKNRSEREKDNIYRFYMGCIFIFRPSREFILKQGKKISLVTVFNPKHINKRYYEL